MAQKNLSWEGSSKEDLTAFPVQPRKEAGHQLNKVQNGLEPSDFKPMPTIGVGVSEIRIKDDNSDQYRVIYIAKYEESIYVLHAFQKTTKKTSLKDIGLAKKRLKSLDVERSKLKVKKE